MAQGVAFSYYIDQRNYFIRGSYLERPEDTTLGFKDKEFFQTILIGKTLKTFMGISHTGIGFGSVEGYIKGKPNSASPTVIRKFKLPTIDLLVLQQFSLGESYKLAIGHQSSVGIGNAPQQRAYVTWPYNVFILSFGVSF